MSKLGSWHFGYVKIDQHLLLEPSIDKRRELSCAPNIVLFLILNYGVTNNIGENGEIIVLMLKNKSKFYFLK